MIQAWHRELDDTIERQKRLESRRSSAGAEAHDDVDDSTWGSGEGTGHRSGCPKGRGKGGRKREGGEGEPRA